MPDYDVSVDGQSYTVSWSKPEPPTGKDFAQIVSGIRGSSAHAAQTPVKNYGENFGPVDATHSLPGRIAAPTPAQAQQTLLRAQQQAFVNAHPREGQQDYDAPDPVYAKQQAALASGFRNQVGNTSLADPLIDAAFGQGSADRLNKAPGLLAGAARGVKGLASPNAVATIAGAGLVTSAAPVLAPVVGGAFLGQSLEAIHHAYATGGDVWGTLGENLPIILGATLHGTEAFKSFQQSEAIKNAAENGKPLPPHIAARIAKQTGLDAKMLQDPDIQRAVAKSILNPNAKIASEVPARSVLPKQNAPQTTQEAPVQAAPVEATPAPVQPVQPVNTSPEPVQNAAPNEQAQPGTPDLDAYIAQERAATLARIQAAKQTAEASTAEPKVLDTLQKTVEDRIADRQKRLSGQANNVLSAVGESVAHLADYGMLGAIKLARGVTDTTAWAKEMLQDYGEEIKPYLGHIFDVAHKYLPVIQGEAGAKEPSFALPDDGPRPYLDIKKGDNPNRASLSDLEQFIQGKKTVPVGTGVADLAKVGRVINPETGATWEQHGGPQFGLDADRYGRAGWANSPGGAAIGAMRTAAHGEGLYIPFSAARDTVLSSHGPTALIAEMRQAVKNGTASEPELMDLVTAAAAKNKNVRGVIKSPVSSIDELERIVNANNKTSSFPFRRALTESVMGKKQSLLPSYDKMVDLMNDPALANHGTGHLTNAVYLDTKSKPASSADLGVPQHPIYAANLPGINLGLLSEGAHLRDFAPEVWDQQRANIIAQEIRAGRDPAALSEEKLNNKTYPQFRQALLTKGGKLAVPAETLKTLTASANAGGDIQGRLAADRSGGTPDGVEVPSRSVPDSGRVAGRSDSTGTGSRLDAQIEATKARIAATKASKKGSLGSTGGKAASDAIENLQDYAVLGALHIAKGAVSFADFSKAMLADAGASIEPHLKAIYQSALDHYHNEIAPKFNLPKVQSDLPAKETLAPETLPAQPAGKESLPTPAAQTETKGANAHMAEARAGLDLSELPPTERKAINDSFTRVAENGEEGNALRYAEDVLNHPRPFTPDEQAAVVLRVQQVKEQINRLRGEIERATAAGDTKGALRLKALHDEYVSEVDTITQANKAAGTEWARSGLSRQLEVNEYDYSGIRSRLTAANPEKPVTPQEEARASALAAKLEDANKQIETQTERIKELEAQRVVTRMAREERSSTRQAKVSDIRQTREDLKAQLVKTASKLSAGLDPEVAKIAAQIARTYVQEGVVKASDLVDRVYTDLKDTGVPLTPRDIRDAISGYGTKSKVQAGDTPAAKLRELQKQMRLVSAIEDAEQGQVPAKGNAPGKPSADVVKLREQLDAEMLKQGLKQPRTLSEATRQKMASDRLKARIDDLTRRIGASDYSTSKAKPIADTPETAALKAQRDALQKQYDANRPPADPLPGIKTRLQSQIDDLNQRIASGNLDAPAKKAPPVYDVEANRLRAQRDRLKYQVDQMIAQRQKVSPADMLTRWHRLSLLSGVSTLGKLSAAASGRILLSPIEDAFGGVVGKAVPGIAGKADVEGGFSHQAELAALKAVFSKETLSDMRDKALTGANSLDVQYGGKGEGAHHPLFDFFGGLHGALKTPAQRGAFARAFSKIASSEAYKTADLRNPETQMQIGVRAYAESQRAILMNDNAAVAAYNAALSSLRRSGHPTAAAAIKTLTPIVKVPTNYVAESAQYAGLGLVEGTARAVRGAMKGFAPEEANATMRAFKKGGIGAGLLAIGYFGAGGIKAGGYYQPGKKPDPNGLHPGDLEIGGVTIPHMFAHNPALEAIQFGASFRRAMDGVKKGTITDKVGTGAFESAKGLATQTPLIETPVTIGRALENPQGFGKAAGNVVKSVVVPQALSQTASYFDKNAAGEPVRRSPKGFGDTLKMGVPGLRQQVPVARPKGGGRTPSDGLGAFGGLQGLNGKL